MEEIILEAEKRQDTGSGKVNRLRKNAFIPAVVYGEGNPAQNIQVKTRDFTHMRSGHRGGESFVLKLRIRDGEKYQEKSVLIKEIQHDPVKDDVVHIDFHEISLTKTIKVKVPLAAKGEAIGVKQDGGVLDHILWELEVECLPANIPNSLEVDVSGLKIGDSLHIKDISIPEGVKILNDPEATILAVSMPAKEEVAPAPEAAVTGEEVKAEPEVIKEKKEKPEAEEGQEEVKEKKK